MKPLMINTSDSEGGAAIATYRLHRGLRAIGLDSQLLVQFRQTDDPSVIGPHTKLQKLIAFIRPYLDGMVNRLYRQRQRVMFSPAWLPEQMANKVQRIDPDLVHLFWVSDGFLRIENLKRFGKPLVWTLHDMWPFTGGCHYDQECGKFRQSCGKCPVLNSERERDLSMRILERKRAAWAGIPIVVVATSHWLADMARASALFAGLRIEVIPNGIDEMVYKPHSKSAARAAYNLPQDKHLILFSAFNADTDRRKGGQFLLQALETMAAAGWGDRAELVVIGASQPENPPDWGMKVHYIGRLHDEISQVLLYSAADVVVAPSMQENLSNTVMESLACGTPVVAYDIGGMPDMIDHQVNGYLATPFDPTDLAAGISWVLEDPNRHDSLAQQARRTVMERYTLKSVASLYSSLYQDMLK